MPRLNRLIQLCKSLISFRRGIRFGAKHSSISSKATIQEINGGTIQIGSNCAIHDYAMILTYGGCISLGNHCTVNPFCVLYGHGGLVIGNGVRIAAHVVIIPSNHNFDDPNSYIYTQGETSLGIVIRDNVWIGAGARILDGVTIEKGAVIGAGAVVTKNVPENAVMAGVPARVIRFRSASNPSSS